MPDHPPSGQNPQNGQYQQGIYNQTPYQYGQSTPGSYEQTPYHYGQNQPPQQHQMGQQQQFGYQINQQNPQTTVPQVFPIDYAKKADRFKVGGYQDMWAIILYAVCKCGFIALTVIAYRGVMLVIAEFNGQAQTTPSNPQFLAPSDIVFVSFSVVLAGFMFSFCYFLAIQRFAGTMIKTTLIISIAFNVIMAIVLVFMRIYVGGLIMLVFAVIYAFFMWHWRNRIPFAKIMLKTVTAITGRYYSVIFVALGGLIFQFIYTCWWAFTVIGINVMYSSSTDNDTIWKILNAYIMFMYYWYSILNIRTSQIIINGVHITVCGVFATFYFKGVSDLNGNIEVPVADPTLSALKRALTSGLGPNIYGSLLIAIIQMIKSAIQNAKNKAGGAIAVQLILACIACLLSNFEQILEYFNKYGNFHLI
jgi:hypothetical protein